MVLRKVLAGFVLGASIGLIWLLVRAMGGLGVNQTVYLVDVVWPPLMFAAIGGLLGSVIGTLIGFIRKRCSQPIVKSRGAASVVGFLIGIVPGLNGLIFVIVFLQCGGDDSLSGYVSGCDDLRTLYSLSATSITVAGGLLGILVGQFLAARYDQLPME